MIRDYLKKFILSSIALALFNSTHILAAESPTLTGEQIVQRCGINNPGKDQISKFEVWLKDSQNNIKHSIYTRLWKDYHGANDIADKMLLFTEFPADAKGSAFMRFTYTHEAGKSADQWIYLPVLRKIRRVTIRDQGDSFLNSELTYADVTPREISQDNYKYTGVKKVSGLEFYVVEATPREKNPLYGKRVLWFTKTPDWNDCANVRIDYYDRKGDLLKEQFIKWQQIDDAWIWDRVRVRNWQNARESIFINKDVQINVGLDDSIFSERSLTAGLDVVLQSIKKPDTTKKNAETNDNKE